MFKFYRIDRHLVFTQKEKFTRIGNLKLLLKIFFIGEVFCCFFRPEWKRFNSKRQKIGAMTIAQLFKMTEWLFSSLSRRRRTNSTNTFTSVDAIKSWRGQNGESYFHFFKCIGLLLWSRVEYFWYNVSGYSCNNRLIRGSQYCTASIYKLGKKIWNMRASVLALSLRKLGHLGHHLFVVGWH